MEENKEYKDINQIDNNENLSKGILSNDDNDEQTLFRLFGIEMTAPKELKNPRVVYISFIVVNFILLIILKNLISN